MILSAIASNSNGLFGRSRNCNEYDSQKQELIVACKCTWNQIRHFPRQIAINWSSYAVDDRYFYFPLRKIAIFAFSAKKCDTIDHRYLNHMILKIQFWPVVSINYEILTKRIKSWPNVSGIKSYNYHRTHFENFLFWYISLGYLHVV